MPNILDNVVRVIRPQKSLDDIYRQLGRVVDMARNRAARRFESFDNAVGPYQSLREAYNESRRFAENLMREIDGMPEITKHRDDIRDLFRNSNTPEEAYSDFYREDFIDYAPTERQIRMDPLMYVDHPSRIVRNFARGLINGDIQ